MKNYVISAVCFAFIIIEGFNSLNIKNFKEVLAMKKRFTTAKAVLMSVCIAVISITAGSSALTQTATADEYEESGIKLRVYNCVTGEESIEVFHPSRPSPMESEDISSNMSDNDDDGGISPNAIIGGDNRFRVTNTTAAPYSYTCYMYSVYKNGDTSGVYSGFMIGPKTAVTAAHCILSDKALDHVVVVPGKNENREPFGRAYSTKVAVTDEYINGGNRADDWAVMELDRNIGDQSNYPILKYIHGTYVGTSVENTGYPSENNCSLQNNAATRMISGKGKVRYSEENDPFGYGRGILKGDWDASGGNSGGPVFAYYSDTGYTVIGILTAGSDDGSAYNSSTCYTTATRISSDMYEIFMEFC